MKRPASGTRPSVRPSPSPSVRNASDEIARATEDYARGLPGKMRALVIAVEQARRGDDGAMVVARSIAHRLHGTAGCYGFRDLGAIAATVDRCLAHEDWTGVDRAMLELENAATLRSA